MNNNLFSIVIVVEDQDVFQNLRKRILESYVNCNVVKVSAIQDMKSVFIENEALLLIISEKKLIRNAIDVQLLVIDYGNVAVLLEPQSYNEETYLKSGALCTFKGSDSLTQLMSLTRYLLKVEEMKNRLLNAIQLNSQKNKNISDVYSKLYNAQDALYKANSMAIIGSIAAGLAHEINNPLSYVSNNVSVLKTYLDTLSRENVEKSEIDYILSDSESLFEELNHGIFRISEIVNSIRFLSKIDTLEMLTEIDVVKEIENLLVLIFTDDAIVIEKNYGDLSQLLIKNRNISIALMNIMQNALYALENSVNPKKIFNIILTEDESSFLLIFKDNGHGMDEEQIEKAFDPFYTTKPEGLGKGLGLSMAYKIIAEECHGEIVITSKKNQFTQVSIRLPKKED